jgi:hypothetical protein
MFDIPLYRGYYNIMKTERYSSRTLRKLLRAQKIASMSEMKEALGTNVDVTIFRKLAELGYRTSYSNRGQYYTLEQIPEFDGWGLWSFRSVYFSKCGTLRATAEALVDESEKGFFATELEALLHVEVKGCLRKLVVEKSISREKVCGRYLYCSSDSACRKEQTRARGIYESKTTPGGALVHDEVMPDELRAAIVLFFSLLDEQQRRIYAGLESLKLGHGGDQRIADLFNLDRGTVAKGREELLTRDIGVEERIRKPGAGRKAHEKKPQRSSSGSKKS